MNHTQKISTIRETLRRKKAARALLSKKLAAGHTKRADYKHRNYYDIPEPLLVGRKELPQFLSPDTGAAVLSGTALGLLGGLGGRALTGKGPLWKWLLSGGLIGTGVGVLAAGIRHSRKMRDIRDRQCALKDITAPRGPEMPGLRDYDYPEEAIRKYEDQLAYYLNAPMSRGKWDYGGYNEGYLIARNLDTSYSDFDLWPEWKELSKINPSEFYPFAREFADLQPGGTYQIPEATVQRLPREESASFYYDRRPDESRQIISDAEIWKRMKDYYAKILSDYDAWIQGDTTYWNNLSKEEQQQLLGASSSEKIKHYSTRGPLTSTKADWLLRFEELHDREDVR